MKKRIQVRDIFSKLTVIGRAGPEYGTERGLKWICVCSCGNEKIVSGSYLHAGTSKSCGMGKCSECYIDLVGKRFFSWTVIGDAEPGVRPSGSSYKKVLCRCDCGTEKSIDANDLKRGRSTRCGKDKCGREDLSEKRFGRLIVIGPSNIIKCKEFLWIVKCDCGSIVNVQSSNLKSGHTRSCGCIRKEATTLPSGEAAFRLLYRTYESVSKTKNRVFNLTEDFFRDIISKNCYYCSKPPSGLVKTAGGSLAYNGIDRVDNSIGYVIDNVVPCCTKCNRDKSRITIDIARKMIDFLDKKEEQNKLKAG